ncbi:MAG: YjfB family protein [Lachnospiraceae bacterium]|nr:YjfB family protein [Lachnospiraceae bacterium]
MDIAALSTALAHSDVMNSVSIAVLDKTMEISEDLGTGLVNMIDNSMELSVNPHIGSNIDVLV